MLATCKVALLRARNDIGISSAFAVNEYASAYHFSHKTLDCINLASICAKYCYNKSKLHSISDGWYEQFLPKIT